MNIFYELNIEKPNKNIINELRNKKKKIISDYEIELEIIKNEIKSIKKNKKYKKQTKINKLEDKKIMIDSLKGEKDLIISEINDKLKNENKILKDVIEAKNNLRSNRVIKKNIISQNIKLPEKSEDVLSDNTIMYLNVNLGEEIKKAYDILKNNYVIYCKLRYTTFLSAEKFMEGVKFTLTYDEIVERIKNNKLIPNEDVYDSILETKTIKKTIDLKDLFKNGLIDKNMLNKKLYERLAYSDSASFGYFISGYDIIIASNNFNIKNYVEELRAYSPSQNKKYHEETKISTTTGNICIYETYYYLYIEEVNIKKNEKEIKDALFDETKEIKNYIKNGELVNFLIAKSKEHDETFYVKFFKSNILGFKVYNDEIEEIKNNDEFNNEKVFLYHNEHVAPYKNIEKDDEEDEDILNGVNNYKPTNKNYSLKQSKIKQYDLPNKILAYDCETFTLNSEGKQVPYCICLSNDKYFYGIDCVIKFIDYLDEIATKNYLSKSNPKNKTEKIYIYSFNGSRFDNIFIFDEIYKRNKSIKYIITDNNIKYLKHYNIEFFDLSLYYTGSLESVSNSFKLEISKGVFPYKFPNSDNMLYNDKVPELKYWKNENDMKEYIKNNGNNFNMKEYTIKYCLLDTKLTQQIAEKHISNSYGEINNKKYDVCGAITGANLSLKMFSQIFLEDTLYSSNKEIQNLERLSYKGGRTECFKKRFNSVNENNLLYYYDINSSYPYSMTKEMPYKFIKKLEINEKIFKSDDIVDYYLYKCKSKYIGNDKYYIPNLLSRSEKGDIIALKYTEESYNWGCEIKEAIISGCEVKISEIIMYEGKNIFESFARYFYNERLKNKDSNPSLANFQKLIMNSLYGKFGQNIKESCVICRNIEEQNLIMCNPNIKIDNFEILGDNIMLKYHKIDDDNKNIGSLVRFSSYISALSRTNLASMMRELGYENIYYCDTDSIFTSKKMDDKYISQTELGKWKMEEKKKDNKKYICEIVHAEFIAPKCYLYKTKDDILEMKAKGFVNSSLKEEHFNKLSSGEKCEIENPSMFFRKLDTIEVRPQIRTLQTVYNKRIWDGNDSYSYDFMDDFYKNKYIIKDI